MFSILADSFQIATRMDGFDSHPSEEARRRPDPNAERVRRRRQLDVSWLMLGRR
ncbi:MAG: hypothetical protein AAFN79_14330 [Pseudomonadota bacterium]